MGQVEAEDRLPCQECERPWMVPRPVVYTLSPYVPKHVPPNTTEAVVAYQSVDMRAGRPFFPEQVFNTIQFTSSSSSCFGYPSKHRLVKDFRYDGTSGEVFDGDSDSKDADKYARLITLNSWYYRLAHTLLYVSFSVVDLQTNLLLFLRTFYDSEFLGNENLQLVWPWLISAYGLMLLACVGLSFSEATRDWAVNSNPKKGDLILGLHWLDTWMTFFAMMLFSFFSVEGMVTDIVILLHPWKGVQPYAAIKLHNARAYTIGWPTRAWFAVENKPNASRSLPAQLFCKTYVFGLKLYVCWLFPRRLDVIIASISSVPSLVMGYKKFMALRQGRSNLEKHLVERLKDPLLPDGPEKGALNKNLFRLFGKKFEDGKLKDQDWRSFCQDELKGENRCTRCGRLHGDDIDTVESQPPTPKEISHNGGDRWARRGDLQVCGHASWIPAKLDVAEFEGKAAMLRRSNMASLEGVFEPDLDATMTMPGAAWRSVREAEDQGRSFAMIFGHSIEATSPQGFLSPSRMLLHPKSTPTNAKENARSTTTPFFPPLPSKSTSPATLPLAVRTDSAMSDAPDEGVELVTALDVLVAPQQATFFQEPLAPAESRVGVRPAQPCPLLQSDDMVHRCLDAGPSTTPEERASDLRAAANMGTPDPRGGVG